ncbi:hypothetical protein M2347_001936 [Chryseobacterium sp. H1D6B]|uniref:hypothetical protein n=1 Tax=Chryseobacterium sp. H1D6B TaxID=2940588 RepID=UPI0015C69912|nr:hypothetical protein [Chryseobacterium sp. H1D6B]MDH6252209.1 hypothetical protein [Chryseobacterium sp. H1D6B]
MKKQNQTQKKMSLQKLQMVKINDGMNSIKGGGGGFNNIGGGGSKPGTGDDTNTVVDKTLKTLKTDTSV